MAVPRPDVIVVAGDFNFGLQTHQQESQAFQNGEFEQFRDAHEAFNGFGTCFNKSRMHDISNAVHLSELYAGECLECVEI